MQRGKSAIIISRKCFKGFIHSTFRCESPLYMKDFRSGKSFTTIQSRKINFNLRFPQSLVEIHYWNLYSKKIIVLGFHLVVRTVNPVFLCFRSSYSHSLHVRESRAVLDSGIHAEDSGFQVLDSRICQWNLDSGFQSLVGFRIPWAVFRIPNPRIPDSISIIFPDSGIRIPLHGATSLFFFKLLMR